MPKKCLWLLVTTDKYELPLAVCDTAMELARIVGTSENTIYSAVCHFNKNRKIKTCRYRKVVIDE
ncbi:MAG: hypothetical protein KBT03_09210 [Bacteroidales bacterium]|nr:hypothetical protein [Candidatus Scybalousia scybalohippi]